MGWSALSLAARSVKKIRRHLEDDKKPAYNVRLTQRPVTGSQFEKTGSLCRGVAKLVKASDFDSDMRRFESFFPCHLHRPVHAQRANGSHYAS